MPPRKPPPIIPRQPSDYTGTLRRARPAVELPLEIQWEDDTRVVDPLSLSTPPAGTDYAITIGRESMTSTSKRLQFAAEDREKLNRAQDLAPFRERVLADLRALEERILALDRRVRVLERGSISDAETERELEVSTARELATVKADQTAMRDEIERMRDDLDRALGRPRTPAGGSQARTDSTAPKAIGAAIGGLLGQRVTPWVAALLMSAISAAAVKACEPAAAVIVTHPVPAPKPQHSGAPPQ